MKHIHSLEEGIDVFKTLGSEVRVEILNILHNNPDINMNEIASQLNITNGALTAHIKKLEDNGLIAISNDLFGHGNTKNYTVCLDKLLVDFFPDPNPTNIFETELKVGQYSDFNLIPTCGLATAKQLIGEIDDIRYFAHPQHYDADILWFTKGYIEYIIPNLIPAYQKVDTLSVSAELSSEAPGFNDVWPSDIHFYLNDIFLGAWTSPGDFGEVKGLFTPPWWPTGWNQYGLLKKLLINSEGTFIDGLHLSNVTIEDLKLDYKSKIKFKLAIPDTAKHIGGLTIFGKGFGNYNQNITIRMSYSPLSPLC